MWDLRNMYQPTRRLYVDIADCAAVATFPATSRTATVSGSGQVSYFVNRQLENQHQHHHSLAPLVTQHLGPIGHTINHTRISNNNNNTSWSPQRTSPTTTTVPGVPIRFGTNSQYSPTTTTTTPATPTPTTTATATTTTNNTTSFPIDHTKPYHLRIDMDNIIAAMGPDVTLFNFVHS
eukprot:TRINITY_DN49_c2_g1_i3.p1 TRINITY_DN49_c2_g1~~TRINITY_DN49_c2_g1_i3.p1  ORF type:complete len:178 (+),score=60.54 TRINITY_DN49_c2_g1_i3:411-944(+)